MSRILKAYRTRFQELLRQAGARRLEQGVDLLVSRAKRTSVEKEIPLTTALGLVCEDLASRPRHQTERAEQKRSPADISFFCDAGLGGLARWLRGAGYCALWEPDISDEKLLKQTQQNQTTLLTTDSMLMERRLLRDRIIPGLWLPPVLRISEQLERVFREFNLTVGHPRCMSCGGQLKPADKETLRDRIPPKTYRWLNEYFLCAKCGKLFWHGTHWLRIVERLRALEQKGTGGNREN